MKIIFFLYLTGLPFKKLCKLCKLMLVCYKSMDNSAIHRIRNSNSSFSASPQHTITPCSYTLSSFLELTNHDSSVNFTSPQAVSTYLNIYTKITFSGFSRWLSIKNPPAMQETQETWVWSLDHEDSWRWAWQPTQYSCLENPMDRRAWWATVHRVAKSQTWLKTTEHAGT